MNTAFNNGNASGVTQERLQISLHACKLKGSQSSTNPFAVVTLLSNNPHDEPRVLGETEIIHCTTSPRWTKTFELDFNLGEINRINVAVFDEETRKNKKKEPKPLGSAMFDVQEVLGSRGNIKAKKCKKGGTLFARIMKAPEKDEGLFKLQLRGIKLKNTDGLFGKSDPFFEISTLIKGAAGSQWKPVYRSKHIDNDLNPVWPPLSIRINNLCAEAIVNGEDFMRSSILISVFDWEKSGKHQAMGSFETSIHDLISAKVDSSNIGANAKNVDTSKALALMKGAGRKQKEYGKVVVIQAEVDRSQVMAVQTPPPQGQFQQQQQQQQFSPAMVPPNQQHQQNIYQPQSQQCETEGEIDLSTGEVFGGVLPPPLPVPKMDRNRPTFVDYVTGGCELSMFVAIDFTGSNGDPRKPGTLHYLHPTGELNDYEKALTAVGSIIARYDFDKRFPVLGFGAKFQGVINHCFQVGQTAEVNGVQGILEAYQSIFRSGLVMSGPTVVSEVITYAAAQARSKQEQYNAMGKQAYSILLILTDGAVTDIEDTKRAIQYAGDAPLSIVIVGIGEADFSKMQFLDDFTATTSGMGGIPQARDIVQFVEFSRHKNDKRALTRETLDEIPGQLVDYFYRTKGIMPLPPISGSQMNLVVEEDFNDDVDIDLSIDFDAATGQAHLTNNNGAVFDDTKYGRKSDFHPSTMGLPPGQQQTAPYNPSAPAMGQQQGGPFGQPYQGQPSGGYSGGHPGGFPGGPPGALPDGTPGGLPPGGNSIFHVQVPPGVSAGAQLQIQHPVTQENMIVTVPPGVPPGGKFGVRY